jgi:hypothetical protein
MEALIPIIGILAVFGIPISAIWRSHLHKMAELKAKQGSQLSPNVQAELSALRAEVAELRETTTRFDMSFDAALTRLEDRVDKTEQVLPVVQTRATEDTPQTMTIGRGR